MKALPFVEFESNRLCHSTNRESTVRDMHSKRHVLYYVSGIVFQLPMAALKAAAQGKGPTGMTSDNYYLTCIILDFDRQKKMLTFGDFVTEQSALISTPGVFFLKFTN